MVENMYKGDYSDIQTAIQVLVREHKVLVKAINSFIRGDIDEGVMMLRNEGYADIQIAFILSMVLKIPIDVAIERVKEVKKDNVVVVENMEHLEKIYWESRVITSFLLEYEFTLDTGRLREAVERISKVFRELGYINENQYISELKIDMEKGVVIAEYMDDLEKAVNRIEQKKRLIMAILTR